MKSRGRSTPPSTPIGTHNKHCCNIQSRASLFQTRLGQVQVSSTQDQVPICQRLFYTHHRTVHAYVCTGVAHTVHIALITQVFNSQCPLYAGSTAHACNLTNMPGCQMQLSLTSAVLAVSGVGWLTLPGIKERWMVLGKLLPAFFNLLIASRYLDRRAVR